MATAKKSVPDGYQTVTPVLTLDNAREAVDWYKRAFGAEELVVNTGPDGKVMHGELRIGNSRIMFHDAMMGEKGPKAFGGSPAGLWIYVDDCDSLFQRAVSAGAKPEMPVGDQFWGDRCGALADPHGYRWLIASHKEDLTPAELRVRQAEFFKNFAPTRSK